MTHSDYSRNATKKDQHNQMLRKDVASSSVLKKSFFDTKNYYYYFTEVWKDKKRL